eukprot:m51a1_g4193 hypothetical protein (225) ;mRNA; r:405142-405899
MSSNQQPTQPLWWCHSCSKTFKPLPTSVVCPTCWQGFVEPMPSEPAPARAQPAINVHYRLPGVYLALRPGPAGAPLRLYDIALPTVEVSGATGAVPESALGARSDEEVERILDRLFRGYQPRGNPPASKRSRQESLREVVVEAPGERCAVCMEDLEQGARVSAMPCGHRFHAQCIGPWLELRNTCPCCRYELPTDDPEYEEARKRAHAQHAQHPGDARAAAVTH